MSSIFKSVMLYALNWTISSVQLIPAALNSAISDTKTLLENMRDIQVISRFRLDQNGHAELFRYMKKA